MTMLVGFSDGVSFRAFAIVSRGGSTSSSVEDETESCFGGAATGASGLVSLASSSSGRKSGR